MTIHSSMKVQIELAFNTNSEDFMLSPLKEVIQEKLDAMDLMSSFDLETRLPFLQWNQHPENNSQITICLLCHHRMNAGKFFYDMMCLGLQPGRKIHAPMFFSLDFLVPELSAETYTYAQISLKFGSDQNIAVIQKNFEALKAEIKLGVVSLFQAGRILEIKGLNADEKISLIQERITSVVQRRPDLFDYDIFKLMQHFLISCKQEFKSVRNYLHMSRMICVFYLFHKALENLIEEKPYKRHVCLKLIRTKLDLPLGARRVLGVFIGMNFLKENEVFEQRHLMKALRTIYPQLQMVDNSVFINEAKENKTRLIYLEVEKKDGQNFFPAEIERIKKALPEDVKNRVEHLTRPVFMPRNEEEVMKYIITLSQQLKYSRDLPQVIVSFEQQSDHDLLFTVICVRLLHPETLPLLELLHPSKTKFHFILERTRKMGVLRNKWIKEASVFSVRLPIAPFLRPDYSVDMYEARQELVSEIEHKIGQVRDYNGGMIAKQMENFRDLKDELGRWGKENEFLLERFFHSIKPIEMRSVIQPSILKVLFLMLLEQVAEACPTPKKIHIFVKKDAEAVYMMLRFEDPSLKREIEEVLEEIGVQPPQLLTSYVPAYDYLHIGLLFFCDHPDEQEAFIEAIEKSF